MPSQFRQGKPKLRAIIVISLAFLVLIIEGCSRAEHETEPRTVHTHTNFSSEIVLESYLNTQSHGDNFLVLTWRAPYERPRADYSVVVHAIDKQGKVLFQFDHQLVNATGFPTSLWKEEQVKDLVHVTLPASYAPDKYTFRIGIWVPGTGKWLEIFATDLATPSDDFYKYRAVLLPDIKCR